MSSRLMLQLLAVMALLTVSIAAQTKYGAGVTLQEETPFPMLQSQPNFIEGKTVRIEALITSVCTTTPCRWIGISGTGGSTYGHSVFARVEAGKMEFPKSVVGRRVTIEGVVASVARDPDPEAKVAAAEFNQENPGAPAFWQLKVTGAVVR
jgi:hypothetical protein